MNLFSIIYQVVPKPACGEREFAMTEMGSVAVVAGDISGLFDAKCEAVGRVAMMG